MEIERIIQLNELHIAKKCNSCINFINRNSKCTIHGFIGSPEHLQCESELQNFKKEKNNYIIIDEIYNKILKNLGVK